MKINGRLSFLFSLPTHADMLQWAAIISIQKEEYNKIFHTVLPAKLLSFQSANYSVLETVQINNSKCMPTKEVEKVSKLLGDFVMLAGLLCVTICLNYILYKTTSSIFFINSVFSVYWGMSPYCQTPIPAKSDTV